MSELLPHQIEQEIQAKGLTAPRITPEDIGANIAEEHYFTGDAGLDSIRFQWLLEDHRDPKERAVARELLERMSVISLSAARADIDNAMGRHNYQFSRSPSLLTFCVLVLRNGFTVTGESACASPENFDAELGRKIARQNAINKVWPLMGYALKDQLYQSSRGDKNQHAEEQLEWRNRLMFRLMDALNINDPANIVSTVEGLKQRLDGLEK